MIVFNCQKCGKEFKSKDDYAGRKFNCSNCDQDILIPTLKDLQQPSAIAMADSVPTKAPPTPPPLKKLGKASSKPKKPFADESSAPSKKPKKSKKTVLSRIFEKPRYMAAALGGLITLQGTIFTIIESGLFSTIAIVVGMVVVVAGLAVEIHATCRQTFNYSTAYYRRSITRIKAASEPRAKARAEANTEVSAPTEESADTQSGVKPKHLVLTGLGIALVPLLPMLAGYEESVVAGWAILCLSAAVIIWFVAYDMDNKNLDDREKPLAMLKAENEKRLVSQREAGEEVSSKERNSLIPMAEPPRLPASKNLALGCLAAAIVLPIFSCIAFVSSLPPSTEADRQRSREEAAKYRYEDEKARNAEQFKRDFDDIQYRLKRDRHL